MRNTIARAAGRARRALALLALVLAPWSVQAQVPGVSNELEAEMLQRVAAEAQRLYGSDEAMDATVARLYGIRISPAHVGVARAQLRSVLLHESYHRYLLQLVLPIAGPGTTDAQLRSAVMEGVSVLQAKGLLRLPAERHEDFAHHLLEMTRVLPPEVCKGLFLGTVPLADANMIERAYMASLPLARFEHIVTLYIDAAKAELERQPNARSLSAEQAALANQAHKLAMVRKVRAALSPEAVARVLRERQDAPARDACTLFTLTIEAMVDLPEPYRTWRILQFVREMQ